MPARRLLAGILAALLLTGILNSPTAIAATMYPSGVGADLGPTPTTLGVQPAAGPDPAGLRTGTEQGRTYWRTNQAAGTEYISFDVDRDYVDELSTDDVLVSVTYLDSGTGTLQLLYDAAADPQASADDVPLTGSGRWRTGTFSLDGIEFADRLGGADLRLSGTEDITIAGLRISTAGASVQFGANPVQAGITVRAGDRPENLVTGVQDGRPYWQTDRTAPAPGTNFFYANVSDTYLYDNRGLVLVSVDYFDAGNGQFGLHYDSPGETIPERFKNSELVSYGDSRTWKTHTFALPDAVMTNRSNGSDFRIHIGNGAVDLKVAAVRVAKVAGTLDVTEGLVELIDEATRAQKSAREGTRDGQYPTGSRAVLLTAIDEARAVATTPGVTDVQVTAALGNLQAKLDAFNASIVDTNFAPTGTATAADGSGATNVNDSNHTTAWSSESANTWLQVDLGRQRPVNDVRVEWAQSSSPDYTVQLSNDGRNFTTVGRTGSPGANQFSKTRFATTKTRYVRVVMTGAQGYSVKELQLRESPVVVPQPKLVPTVNPTEDGVVADFDATRYGADRTGRTDSTKAIQNAIYACQDAGGGTVWLPAGRYLVKDTVEVHAFCTLRGDRRDPDAAGPGDYGTVVIADLASGDDGPSLFRIGGSAGVIGVTTWYPRQSATSPVPYNYTFEIPGGAWIGNENYMMATVQDVTLLNSYRGIGISTMPNDRGNAPSSGQVHESSTLRNIRGTALSEGARAYNGADVGTWENVAFNNSYWAQAPAKYQPPARSALDTWTRAHGTGLVLGDLEWDQFHRISLADYKVGIHVVAGQRAQFTGSFLEPDIRRTGTGVLVDVIDDRWGMTLAGGHVQGSEYAVRNNARGYVKITGTQTMGAVTGIVHRMSGTAPTYTQRSLPAPARKSLTLVDAPHGVGYLPTADATAAIQRALDKAGRDGGGIVYLPAGWYRIARHLSVPAKVELRGASAVPNRDQGGASGGTVLHAFEGRGTNAPDTATALVTLNGANSGIRGLRVFYPEQNPGKAEGVVPYPYAIRGNGARTYVVNAGFPNAWNGIDLTTYRNDGFVVRKVAGAFFDHAISVGRGTGGRIEGVLSNGNAVTRIGYQQPYWMNEGSIFELVIDKYMRKIAKIVTVYGATGLTLFNVFAYGFHDGLVVHDGEVDAFNLGTDNLGTDGYTVRVTTGDVEATNLARYNGATSTGPVTLRNVMVINVVQRRIAAEADGDGTVRLDGNESEPGTYEVGTQVTATATPGSDSVFRNWTIDGQVVSADPGYTFTVTTDQVLTAHFTAREERNG